MTAANIKLRTGRVVEIVLDCDAGGTKFEHTLEMIELAARERVSVRSSHNGQVILVNQKVLEDFADRCCIGSAEDIT